MKGRGAARVFIALGFVLLFFLGLVSILGLRPSTESDPTRDRRPGGYSLLRRFLAELGYAPQLRPDPATLWEKARAIVLFDVPEWDDEGWSALEEWVEGGGLAVCLGGEDDAWLTGLTYRPGSGTLVAADGEGSAADLGFDFSGKVFGPLPEDVEGLAGIEAGPAIARWAYGEGAFVFLSDPSLLDNMTMRSGGEEYAVLVNEAFRPSYDGPVYFHLPGEAGGGSPSDPVRGLFRGRFLPFTLQALAVFAVLGLSLALRFGSPLAWNGRARRASLEHVEAVGRFMLRAGGAGLAEASGAAYFRYRLRTALKAGADRGDESLAEEAIARLSSGAAGTKYGKGALMALLECEAAARDGEMRKRSRARADILQALERSPL